MDVSEEINQYFQNISITPINSQQEQLNVWADNTAFDPSKLDSFGLEKKIISDAVMKCLEHMNNIPNSNSVRTADGLLSRKQEDLPVDWIGKSKARTPSREFKTSDQFYLECFLTLPNEVWFCIVKKIKYIDVFNFSIKDVI